jgi:hypothetical protein
LIASVEVEEAPIACQLAPPCFPTTADGEKIEFRASKVLGCLVPKGIEGKLVRVSSVTEFRYFCRYYEQLHL